MRLWKPIVLAENGKKRANTVHVSHVRGMIGALLDGRTETTASRQVKNDR